MEAGLKNNLPKKTYLVIIDQIIVSGGNFVIIFALARYLSKPEFGAFVIAQSFLYLAMQIHNALIVSPVGVLVSPLGEMEARTFIKSLNQGQVLVSSVLVGIAIILSGSLLLWSDTKDYFPISMAMTGVIFFNLSQSYLRHLLFARFRLADALLNDLVCYGLQLVFTLVLVFSNTLSALTAILVIGVTSLLACLYGLYQCKDYLGKSNVSLLDGLRPCIEYGKWLVGTGIIAWLRANLNLYLAAYFLGITAPAILKAVQTLFGPTHILLNGLESIVPQFASRIHKKGGLQQLHTFLLRLVIVLTLGMLLYSGITAYFSEEILNIVYGNQYSGYGAIVVIVAIQYVIVAMLTGPNIALRVNKLPRLIFKANIIDLCITCLTSITFITLFGLSGAAITKVFSGILLLFLLLFFYRKSVCN